jgi:hypothetical protein
MLVKAGMQADANLWVFPLSTTMKLSSRGGVLLGAEEATRYRSANNKLKSWSHFLTVNLYYRVFFVMLTGQEAWMVDILLMVTLQSF